MDRLKVRVGTFKIGDVIDDKAIVSFGKTWIENLSDESHFKGQLWEECSCGKEPVYLPSQKCEKCINARFGKPAETCYAYFTAKSA
jgi:hypothetical protein